MCLLPPFPLCGVISTSENYVNFFDTMQQSTPEDSNPDRTLWVFWYTQRTLPTLFFSILSLSSSVLDNLRFSRVREKMFTFRLIAHCTSFPHSTNHLVSAKAVFSDGLPVFHWKPVSLATQIPKGPFENGALLLRRDFFNQYFCSDV
jgi:hypothetical protein